MESNGSQDSSHGDGRRSRRQPMESREFMFIDTAGAGVNAKPDKAVRSFVMKSARRKKPWSTRQKSPKTETNEDGSSPPSPPPMAVGRPDDSPTGPRPWQEFAPSPTTRFSPSQVSPLSSRSCSIVSIRSQPYITSPLSQGTVCDVFNCTGECGQPPSAHTALAKRDGFNLEFDASFDCLPVPTDRKMRGLLENFVNIYSSLLIPLDRHQSAKASTTQWVRNAVMSDTGAPLIYAFLTSSALYPMGTDGNPGDVLHYKMHAIKEVNALLSIPDKSVDDNNIAAVFMLLCLEESQLAGQRSQEEEQWSEEQRKVHLAGLQAMIQQRGGLSALGKNPCLQVFILMHSIAHAISTFERPYVTLVDATGQIQPYDIPTFRSRPVSTKSTLALFRRLKLDSALLDIVSNIAVFIGDLAYWFEDRQCPLNAVDLQKHVSLLTYRLFDWYKQGEQDPMLERSPVDQSICLALLIFLVRAYEDQYLRMTFTAVCKLRSALRKCILRWSRAPDLLMWTLTMGALAAQGTPEFAFFKHHSGTAFADQGFDEFTNPEELLDRMRKIMWLRRLDEEVKGLWAQMGLCKGEEVIETTERELSPPSDEVQNDRVVGALTSDRFFGRKSESR